MEDSLIKSRKNDSNIYYDLASSVNATNTNCFKNTCFDGVGKFEAGFKIECSTEP